jgi:hypothetical protein
MLLPMRQSTVIARLLLECVREHDWSVPPEATATSATGVDLDALAAAARFHGVTGCVYRSLGEIAGTQRAAGLRSDYLHAIGCHLQALADLANLAPVLDSLDVRWLVVKGPVLAEDTYPQPDLRAYNDLDLLVPRPKLGQVLTAIEEAGSELIDRNWPLLRQLRVGEMLLRLSHGTLLDLHWDLLNQAAWRQTFTIPMAEMFDRARSVRLGAARVMTLDATDALLHLGLHGCLSGGNRLVWLKDVERAIASDPPSWDDVVRRARAWGIGPPVALTLKRAAALLGASVPEGLPQALAGGKAWLGMAAVADRFSPPERSAGYRSLTRIVSRSTRRDTRSSAAELGRHVVEAVTGRNRFSVGLPLPDIDPNSSTSTRHPAGRPSDREVFLHEVADEAL